MVNNQKVRTMKKKMYKDPTSNLDEIMREDAEKAAKAETLAIVSIILSLISLGLSLLRLLMQIAKWQS